MVRDYCQACRKPEMKYSEKHRIQTSIEIDSTLEKIWDAFVTISNYRTWNPIISHASIYGPVAEGTEIKFLSGRWDFNFTIVDVHPPVMFRLKGGSVGLNMKMVFGIESYANGSRVKITCENSGWLFKLSPRLFMKNIESSLDLFLTALQRRVEGGSSYEITRDDDKSNGEDDEKYADPPTPFNMLYKTRGKKNRRRGPRLK